MLWKTFFPVYFLKKKFTLKCSISYNNEKIVSGLLVVADFPGACKTKVSIKN